jgi:hypothetical protein
VALQSYWETGVRLTRSASLEETRMDPVPLLSALGGALIGALSSISTLLIQSHYQTKREMKKLAIEIAREDFHARIQDQSGQLDALPASVLIFYYDRLIDMVGKGQLTPENIGTLLREQAELYTSIQQEMHRWRSTPETESGHTA